MTGVFPRTGPSGLVVSQLCKYVARSALVSQSSCSVSTRYLSGDTLPDNNLMWAPHKAEESLGAFL